MNINAKPKIKQRMKNLSNIKFFKLYSMMNAWYRMFTLTLWNLLTYSLYSKLTQWNQTVIRLEAKRHGSSPTPISSSFYLQQGLLSNSTHWASHPCHSCSTQPTPVSSSASQWPQLQALTMCTQLLFIIKTS